MRRVDIPLAISDNYKSLTITDEMWLVGYMGQVQVKDEQV